MRYEFLRMRSDVPFDEDSFTLADALNKVKEFLIALSRKMLKFGTVVALILNLRNNLQRVALAALLDGILSNFTNLKKIALKAVAIAENQIGLLALPIAYSLGQGLIRAAAFGTLGSMPLRALVLTGALPFMSIPAAVTGMLATLAAIFTRPINAFLARNNIIDERQEDRVTDPEEDNNALNAEALGAVAGFMFVTVSNIPEASMVGAAGAVLGKGLLEAYRSYNVPSERTAPPRRPPHPLVERMARNTNTNALHAA